MSAEIYEDSPRETADVYAVRLFNNDREWHASIHDFTQKIFDNYEQAPGGAVELIRMKRAAQFITNSPSASFSPQVQAVFNGELIGSQLINYMHPEAAPVGGLAHAYVQSKFAISQNMVLEDTRPYFDPIEEKTIVPPLNEPTLQRQGRMAYFAKLLRDSLSDGDEDNSLPDELEHLIESVASELNSDQDLIDHTKMGARLILNEHLFTSLNKITDTLLGEDDDEPVLIPETSVDAKSEELPEKKSPEKARESYAPSDDALAELTGIENKPGDIEEYFTIEDGAVIRNNLFRKFKKLLNLTGDLDLTNEKVADAAYTYFEEELDKFNEKYQFIKKGDTLIVCGDFFAFATDGDEGAITRYREDIEIRGQFIGISVVEIPSNKELLKTIKREQNGEGGIKEDADGTKKYEINNLTFSPSLQIINPVVMAYDGPDLTPRVYNLLGLTLDIPLLYRNVNYQVLKAEEE